MPRPARRSNAPISLTDDVCRVVRINGAEAFQVWHYPSREALEPCCRFSVTVRDEDRAQAIPEADPHGHAAALLRVDREIARRHEHAEST